MVEFAINIGFTPFFVNSIPNPALPLCIMDDTNVSVGGDRLFASQLGTVSKATIRRSLEPFLTSRVSVAARERDAMAAAQDRQKVNADRHGRVNTWQFQAVQYVLVNEEFV